MAISDHIFKSGTCLKKDFYKMMCDSLVEAGWTNVSSKPDVDGDVFYSKGNAGDKDLYINIRKINSAGANPIDSTVYSEMSFRHITSYTPGDAGAAGTFVRPGSWYSLFITAYGAMTSPVDLVFSYKKYVDKNKIIMVIEYPPAFNHAPILFYLGEPDSIYCVEPGNRGLLYAHSSYFVSTGNCVLVNDAPGGLTALTAPEALPLIYTLSPKNPNNNNKYLVSTIYYGNTTESVRGKLDGVLMLPNMGVTNGDNIVIGAATYYVVVCQSYSTSSFPSLALAIRIS